MKVMDKQGLNKAVFWTMYIKPVLVRAGWDVITQIRVDVYFTKGQVNVADKTQREMKRNLPTTCHYLSPSIHTNQRVL